LFQTPKCLLMKRQRQFKGTVIMQLFGLPTINLPQLLAQQAQVISP